MQGAMQGPWPDAEGGRVREGVGGRREPGSGAHESMVRERGWIVRWGGRIEGASS